MFKSTPLFRVKGKPYYLTLEANVDAKLFMFISGVLTAIMIDWIAETLGLTWKGFIVAALLSIAAVALSYLICEISFEPSMKEFDEEAEAYLKDTQHENTSES